MLYWLNLPENEAQAGWWGEDLHTTIQKVAEDYRREQWFNWQCYIGSTQVTLAQMLYWLWVAEWGFLNGSAGMRTNNPWSLRKWMWMKKVINTHNIDNAKARPEYATMYDWLYEKAHLIASPEFRYKCNYTFESAFAYTSWPNAERTEARVQNAKNHINNALRGAMKFANNTEAVVEVQEVAQVINTYEIARQASIKRQNAEKELIVAKDNFEKSVQNEVKKRWDCKKEGSCKD